MSRCVVGTRWGEVWWSGRVINYPEHSGTLASSRSGVKLSCQRCLSDFPHHMSSRWWRMTAARRSSSPAAAPHLACNSSASEHTGPASVHASARRVAPEPASPPSAVAEEKGSDHLPKTRRRGQGAVDFCPRVWGRSGLFELEGCLFGCVCAKRDEKECGGEKEMKTAEGHRLGRCIVHSKASGPAVLLGQSLRWGQRIWDTKQGGLAHGH